MTVSPGPEIYVPNKIRQLAERVADDWEALMFDGFGIMASPEQVEARLALGRPGPRNREAGDPKTLYLSGGQRAGKTVELMGWHSEACLYKNGVDNADARFWRNYLYKTLAGAPTGELALRLWQIFDEVSKGASDAQWDRGARRARGGKFLHLFKAGKAGDWPVVRFENGARIDFRSFEGYAYRVEGDQWWFCTYDEWASQPDREIEFVDTDVLMGRLRDHDGKKVLAAWPKEQTEHHLIKAIRRIEAGDRDSKVFYLSAENAPFTNRSSLKAERLRKSDAQWSRTVLGRPAGGASIEFPREVVDNMVIEDLPFPSLPYEQMPGPEHYHYFTSWDLGLAHDSTVGITWRLPLVGVSPTTKARIVNAQEIRGSEGLTLDSIAYAIAREQGVYRSQSAIDATGLGGVAAIRSLRDLEPAPLRFVAKSNDRIHGNMRLAAITNGLDLLTWSKPDDEGDGSSPWGLVETPRITPLLDQLANFDRDAKNQADDWVWAFLIGLWYIKRYFVVALGSSDPVPFDLTGPTRERKQRFFVDMRGTN